MWTLAHKRQRFMASFHSNWSLAFFVIPKRQWTSMWTSLSTRTSSNETQPNSAMCGMKGGFENSRKKLGGWGFPPLKRLAPKLPIFGLYFLRRHIRANNFGTKLKQQQNNFKLWSVHFIITKFGELNWAHKWLQSRYKCLSTLSSPGGYQIAITRHYYTVNHKKRDILFFYYNLG